MTHLKRITIVLMICSCLTLNAQEFTLKSKESNLTWTGKAAFNSYSLTGSLKAKTGMLKIENNEITELNIIIDMKSLDHENNDLKRHLKSADFFEVKTYSEAEFKLNKPARITNGKTRVSGNLVIKNNTKQELFDIDISINKTAVTIQFSKDLDRTVYGIKHNSPSFFKDMKENAIADMFKLQAKLVFQKK